MAAFDEFYPFDQGKGSQANATRWRRMGRLFMPDGAVMSGGDQLGANNAIKLQASLSGGNLIVQPGAVCIHGYYAELLNPVSIPVGVTGIVAAQADLDNEVVTLEWLSGVTDYSGLARTEHMWQVPLWLITNSTQLDWMGNSVNPGRALGTFAAYQGGWLQTSPGNTSTWNCGKVRFSQPCLAFFHVWGSFTLSDARYIQNAVWSLDLNYNQPGEILWPVPAVEPFYWAGGSGLSAPPYNPVFNCSFSCMLWVPAGLYTVGVRISAGQGATWVGFNYFGISTIQLGSMSNV
jgi:hypothetical protein